jgi:Spy/CpxP family protein refolding chaperone
VRRKLLILAIVVVTIFNVTAISTLAYVHLRGGRLPVGEPPAGPQDDRIFGKLGLTDEQRQEMRDSRDEFFKSTWSVAEKIDSLHRDIFEQLKADQPDTAYVFDLVEEVGRLQVRMHKQAISHMLSEGQILDPDQKRALWRMLERQLGKQWEHRRQFRGPHGRGKGLHGRPLGLFQGVMTPGLPPPPPCRQDERTLSSGVSDSDLNSTGKTRNLEVSQGDEHR